MLEAAEVFDLAQSAPSRAAFRREVMLRLQRSIGSDIALFHELAPQSLDMSTVIGLQENFLARAAEKHIGPYSEGLLAALSGSRAVVDAELFGPRLRDMSFFNEVSRPAGISQLMYGLISFQGRSPAFVALGRARGEGFSDEDCAALQRLIQPLTMADAALAGIEATRVLPSEPFTLTMRQQELISYVRLGLTNQLIATALGISPNTVRNQLAELFRLCGVSNRAELVHATRGSK